MTDEMARPLQLGVMYPGDEFTTVDGLDEWAAGVEAAGYAHVVFGDHVVGVDDSKADEGWSQRWSGRGPAYTHQTKFREPLTVLSYLAGRTNLGLMTGILIAPQRQTALLAKQVAELDILCNGRLRLGLGIGWNKLEYASLGAEFETRGKALDEQIDVLRSLWLEPSVSFDGAFHQLKGVGLSTFPVQQPVPIWIGGDSDAAARRVARTGDGWILSGSTAPDDELEAKLSKMRAWAAENGRDPESIGLEGRLILRHRSNEEVTEEFERWRALGATHLCIDTRYAGLVTPTQHIESLTRAFELLRSPRREG